MPAISWSLLASALSLLMLLPGCSSRNGGDPATVGRQRLATPPPAFQEQLAQEPRKDREAFLDRPPAEQEVLTTEWQRQEQILQQFTPAERTIISALSQPDSDDFFRIPAQNKAAQEHFLTESISAYLSRLDACLVNTHRRFGPAAQFDSSNRSLATYTPPEQVLIRHLTSDESKQFFLMSKDRQETFLSDRLNRRLEQLLSCETRSNRRLGEPE